MRQAAVFVLLVDRGGGDKPLDVEVIRVSEEANEGLRVVGFVFDVGEDEHSLLGLLGGRVGADCEK